MGSSSHLRQIGQSGDRIRVERTPTLLLLLVLMATACQVSVAQEMPAPPADNDVFDGETVSARESPQRIYPAFDSADDFWQRATLSGEWGGHRTWLRESGVTFRIRETQFAFGLVGGINAPVAEPLGQGDTFRYTGVGLYETVLDFEKLSSLKLGTLRIALEQWYGEYGNVSLRTGTISPPLTATLLPPAPDDPGIPFLTNFLWTQPLSERFVIYAGKESFIGAFDQAKFAGGDGTNQFINLDMIENPALVLGVPYSSYTAGFISAQEWGEFRSFMIDPTERTMEFFSGDSLFSLGIIIGSELTLKYRFFSRPGQHRFGGFWKHVPLTDLQFEEPPPGVYPEPTVPDSPTIDNSWTMYYGFDQYVVQYGDGERGWGVFARASVSDGNPNPVRYFLSCGLGGYSPFRQQQGDMFGIGWYYLWVSTEFGSLPEATYRPRNGTGLELYYNVQATPSLNITPNIQFLRPEATAIADAAFLYGLRVTMEF